MRLFDTKTKYFLNAALASSFALLTACGGGSSNSVGALSSSNSGGSLSGISTGNSSNTDSSNSTAVVVELTWSPNPGANVDGYAVSYGPAENNVSTPIANIATTLQGFNPSSPVIYIDVNAKLGLNTGDRACFSIQAYNDAGYTSASPATCVTL